MQTAPDKVAPKISIAASLDPQQAQQIALDVAALRQTVEQIAASQTKMAAEINNLLVTDMEILLKIPTPVPTARCVIAQADVGRATVAGGPL